MFVISHSYNTEAVKRTFDKITPPPTHIHHFYQKWVRKYKFLDKIANFCPFGIEEKFGKTLGLKSVNFVRHRQYVYNLISKIRIFAYFSTILGTFIADEISICSGYGKKISKMTCEDFSNSKNNLFLTLQ